MVDQAVIDFIQNQREEGINDDEIFRALNVIGGWDKSDFDDAIREIDGGVKNSILVIDKNPFSEMVSPVQNIPTVSGELEPEQQIIIGEESIDTKPFETTFTPEFQMSAPAPVVPIQTPVLASLSTLTPLSYEPMLQKPPISVTLPVVNQSTQDHPTFAVSLAQLSAQNKPGYVQPQSAYDMTPVVEPVAQFVDMGISDNANPFQQHAPISAESMNQQILQPLPVSLQEQVVPIEQSAVVNSSPFNQSMPIMPAYQTPAQVATSQPQSYSAPMPVFAVPIPSPQPLVNTIDPTRSRNQKMITFFLFIIFLAAAGYLFIQSQKGLASEVINKLSFLNKKDKEILHDVAYSKLFSKYPGLTLKTKFTGTLTLKTPLKESFSMLLGVPIQELKDEEKISYSAERDLIKFGSTYHERSKGELSIGKTTIPFEMIVIDPVIYIRRVDGQSLGQTRGIEGAPSNIWFMIDPRHLDELQYDSVKMASFSGESAPLLFKKILRQFDKQKDLVNVAKSDANAQRLQFVYDDVLNTSVSKFNFGNWVDEIFGSQFNPSLTKGFTDLLFNQKISKVDVGIDKETKDPITLGYHLSLTGSQALGDLIKLEGNMQYVVSSRLQGTGAVIAEPGTPIPENDEILYQLFGSLGENEGIISNRVNETVDKLETLSAENPGELVVDVIGAFTRNRQIDLDNQIKTNLTKLLGLLKSHNKEKKTYEGACDSDPGIKLVISDTKNMSDSLVCEDNDKEYRIVVQSVSQANNLYCISNESSKVQNIVSPEEQYALQCKTQNNNFDAMPKI